MISRFPKRKGVSHITTIYAIATTPMVDVLKCLPYVHSCTITKNSFPCRCELSPGTNAIWCVRKLERKKRCQPYAFLYLLIEQGPPIGRNFVKHRAPTHCCCRVYPLCKERHGLADSQCLYRLFWQCQQNFERDPIAFSSPLTDTSVPAAQPIHGFNQRWIQCQRSALDSFA